MKQSEELEPNEVAFRSLKDSIDARYPEGRFVALHGGKIVADDASLDSLLVALVQKGIRPLDVLVVQSHEEYPEKGIILHARQNDVLPYSARTLRARLRKPPCSLWKHYLITDPDTDNDSLAYGVYPSEPRTNRTRRVSGSLA